MHLHFYTNGTKNIGVNKRWWRVARDNSLWRVVDLSAERLTLRRLTSIVQAYLTPVLQRLYIRGLFDHHTRRFNRCRSLVSNALLVKLRKICPNIHTLHLSHTNIFSVDSSQIPPDLTELQLRYCRWPTGWMKRGVKVGTFSRLVSLDLSECADLGLRDIKDILQLPLLKHLNLNGCKNLDYIFTSIPPLLAVLETLKIRRTSISKSGIVLLQAFKNLRKLDCGRCSAVDDICIIRMCRISESLHKLEELCLSGCRKVTNLSFRYFNQLTALKRLDIRNTGITSTDGLDARIQLIG